MTTAKSKLTEFRVALTLTSTQNSQYSTTRPEQTSNNSGSNAKSQMLIWNPPLASLHIIIVMDFMINKITQNKNPLTLISGGNNNAHRVPINRSNKII